MSIVRTKSIELSTIPAIAYKHKLPVGGACIKILRLDIEADASATLDRRTGEAKPYGKFNEKLFPPEAFEEAIELTSGMPYSARDNIKIAASTYSENAEQDKDAELIEQPETLDMVESDEYKAIVERYSDERGNLNYTLMNKDFIQFAAKSKTVADMVASKALTDDILLFIVKSRTTFLSGKKESLDDKSIAALIETLDEINPRSAFKELKNHINKLLAKKRTA